MKEKKGIGLQKDRVGVIGAGTMGSGIALTALLANLKVVLYDLEETVLSRAFEYIEKHLNRKQKAINIKYLTTTTSLEKLRGCGFVIEAAPEILSLKQDLFVRLSSICPAPAILATNTSTLPVTAIVSAAENPERAGGMHFFNPAPVMPLIEVIQGAGTAPETVEALVALAHTLGKTPVVARDTPGFIVNRVARPFYGEALRLLGEGSATHVQIDRAVREGAGFRMGPFELMDLIGIDINFSATQSVYDQTFGEPRYRPHLIQAQMVQQNALGRKTGRGFYTYNEKGEPAEQGLDNPKRKLKNNLSSQCVLLVGNWAPGLEENLRKKGLTVQTKAEPGEAVFAAFVASARKEGLREQLAKLDHELPTEVPLLCQCAEVTLDEAGTWVKNPARLAGFDGLFASGDIFCLVASPSLTAQIRSTLEDLAFGMDKEVIWIGDTPGLILPRIICMLANEAAFAAGEKVADPATIDQAMQLGTNYPIGPLAWAKEIGYDRVITVLEHLQAEYGEDRYRVAPLLRRLHRQLL